MKKSRVHRCKQKLHSNDVAIRYDKINVEEWHWICEQTEVLDLPPDKKSRRAETKTSTAFHIMLIRYCPFCGKELHDQ